MESHLFETDLRTNLEPGTPGGETPPSTAGETPAATDDRFMETYPESPVARDRWIVGKRPAHETLDPRRPAGWFLECEPSPPGEPVSVLTVLLTNRECPWRCVFCDLWRHTLTDKVAPGDITAQLDLALSDPSILVPRQAELKLYNAGSFFDAAAIPPEDDPAIVAHASAFRRLIVESHPSLVGDRCWRLRDRLRAGRGGLGTALEVAMGLETVNPAVLGLLNKRVTLEAFDAAAAALRREGVSLRSFVLVQPPFEAPGEAVDWAVRSVEHAWNVGARVVTLIPVRGGNGALEALQAMGRFRPPRLSTLEAAFEACLSRGRGLVMADTWDLECFADCAVCFAERKERLSRMNLAQTFVPGGSCPACGWHAHSAG